MTSLLCAAGDVLAQHANGRAWIIGQHGSGAVHVLDVGSTRVAILGECLAAVRRRAIETHGGVDELMVSLLSLPGSFHIVITGSSGLVAAGDVAGFRRLFTASTDGTALVASHADVLRRLLDAPIDRTWLAAKLASPEPPSVLRDTLSPFAGVTPVPAGHLVRISGRTCRTSRWWTSPQATQPLASGGAALRQTLIEAVAGRIDCAGGPVSVQLSGGLDSTSLAFLARSARPLLITTTGRSPIDDDLTWACRAADLLKGSPHRVIPHDQTPLFFADLNEPQLALDEPAPFAAGRARQRFTARFLSEYGTVAHLNGQGGDEVLLAPLAYLRPAIRAVPRTGWRHLRGHAALKNIPSLTMARTVLHSQASFAKWLRGIADTVRIERPAAIAATGWEAPPLLPPWITDEAAELVRAAILAADPTAIAADPVTHAAVARIRASAYRAALYRDAMQADGVPTAMPYFDRHVVEACLSVLPWERTDPWCPKPLLRSAFLGVIPGTALSRRTKGAYNADIYHGWNTHRLQVSELLDSPRLAEQGLIDPARMRALLTSFGPGGLPPVWITDLIAVETWLRDLAPPFKREEANNAVVSADPTHPRRDQACPCRGDRAC